MNTCQQANLILIQTRKRHANNTIHILKVRVEAAERRLAALKLAQREECVGRPQNRWMIMLRKGHKIRAIKAVKEATGFSLYDAKTVCDELLMEIPI